MRRSIGYGAYDGFGEDVKSVAAPDATLYKGPTPIRFGRGSMEVRGKDEKGPLYKRYTIEAGMTPFGIFLAALGGSGLIYLIFRLTGKLFLGGG